jgi:hypothetical protein
MKATLCISLILVCLVVAVSQERPTEMSGYITNTNKVPLKGVVVSVGSFSVATDDNGYYKIAYLKPGSRIVSLSPSGKVTRSRRVALQPGPNRQNFTIDW